MIGIILFICVIGLMVSNSSHNRRLEALETELGDKCEPEEVSGGFMAFMVVLVLFFILILVEL